MEFFTTYILPFLKGLLEYAIPILATIVAPFLFSFLSESRESLRLKIKNQWLGKVVDMIDAHLMSRFQTDIRHLKERLKSDNKFTKEEYDATLKEFRTTLEGLIHDLLKDAPGFVKELISDKVGDLIESRIPIYKAKRDYKLPLNPDITSLDLK